MRGKGTDRYGLLRVLSVVAFLVAFTAIPGCSPARTEALESENPPRRGGVLRLLQEQPTSLDPIRAGSVYESLPLNQIFDRLVAVGPSLTIVPAIAESWTVCRSGTSYHFDIRDGVEFHDGSPLTADDVIFSLSRIFDPAVEHRSLAFSYLSIIEGAEAYANGEAERISGLSIEDDGRVRIRLIRSYPSFLEVLAMVDVSIVSRRQVERDGDAFGRSPVGTGPFRLVEWNEGALVLEANTRYFGEPPLLDGLEIRFPGDRREEEFDRLVRGDVDVIEPDGQTAARLERRAQIRLYDYQELSLAFLGLNSSSPPLDQVWLRRAIAHAIDRNRLVAGSPTVRRSANGILPPGIAAYSPENKTLPHRPEESRRLLREAGYPGGEGLPPVELWAPGTSASVQEVIEQICDDLANVGISLTVRDVTWAELEIGLSEGTAPMFLLGWVADLTDPDAFLRSLFESGGSGNYFAHDDRRTDMLLTLGAREANPVERARLYRRLERHVLDDAPLVPLYHTKGVVAMHYRVAGLAPGPLGMAHVDFERVWLRSPRGRS